MQRLRLALRLLPMTRGLSSARRNPMSNLAMVNGVKPGQLTFQSPLSTAAPQEQKLDPLVYDDSYIKSVLADARTIAMVGASPNWNRPSFFAMKYLQAKGYRVIPVNPAAVGKHILGELVYGDLKSVPVPVDMVDVFRNSEAAGPITDEAIQIGAKIVWMQLGVRNAEAAAKAEAAGLKVVQDRCPKIEFSRLFGELGWHGFNSGVISSKRRPVGVASGKGDAAAGKGDAAADGKDAKPKLPDIVFRGFETRSIHAGASPDPTTGARSTPIFQTTAYGAPQPPVPSTAPTPTPLPHPFAHLTRSTTRSLPRAHPRGQRLRSACCSRVRTSAASPSPPSPLAPAPLGPVAP